MAKVFLGVGHGGADSGAAANGFKEKDINLVMALACNDELVRHGVTTLMSRTKDENDTLSQEVAECNAFNPDLAVDIHNNAGGGDGAEAFYHYKGGTGKVLAENILAEIVKLGQNSRGAKTRVHTDGKDWYGFIRNTNPPAVIVEGAFLDNANDVKAIDTEAEQKAFGVAIAKGILKTLGIAYKESSADNATAVRYRVQVGTYSDKAHAEAMLAKAKAAGFADAYIVEESATAQKPEVVKPAQNPETVKPTKKSVDEIAAEVINGDWGNGEDRKQRLTAAGYDYGTIQNRVNELCK